VHTPVHTATIAMILYSGITLFTVLIINHLLNSNGSTQFLYMVNSASNVFIQQLHQHTNSDTSCGTHNDNYTTTTGECAQVVLLKLYILTKINIFQLVMIPVHTQ